MPNKACLTQMCLPLKGTGSINTSVLEVNLTKIKDQKTESHNLLSISFHKIKYLDMNIWDTGANFVHDYIEIWDKSILKFNKFSMYM